MVVEHISVKCLALSTKKRIFFAFIIIDVHNLEQEVDLVLSNILMQVFELRISLMLERLPVIFATKLEQDILDFLITVRTTGENT
jgi:hypothetical protein